MTDNLDTLLHKLRDQDELNTVALQQEIIHKTANLEQSSGKSAPASSSRRGFSWALAASVLVGVMVYYTSVMPPSSSNDTEIAQSGTITGVAKSSGAEEDNWSEYFLLEEDMLLASF